MALKIESADLSNFNDNQRMAIQLLSNQAVSKMTFAEIAKECEITTKTLYRYRQDPSFNDCIVDQAFEAAKGELPAILASLILQAKKGSGKHIEILFKLYSLLGDTSKVEVNVGDVQHDSDSKIQDDIVRMKKELEKYNTPLKIVK